MISPHLTSRAERGEESSRRATLTQFLLNDLADTAQPLKTIISNSFKIKGLNVLILSLHLA